jgi:hypothetical protein
MFLSDALFQQPRLLLEHHFIFHSALSTSYSALAFIFYSSLITFFRAQYPGILSAKPPPTAATSHLFWRLATGNRILSFTLHSVLCTLYCIAALSLNCRRDPTPRGSQPEQPRKITCFQPNLAAANHPFFPVNWRLETGNSVFFYFVLVSSRRIPWRVTSSTSKTASA